MIRLNGLGVGLALLSVSCGSPGSDGIGPEMEPGGMGGASTDPDEPNDQSWPNQELGFNPSNFDLQGDTAERVDDLVVNDVCELRTTDGAISCADEGSYIHWRVMGEPYSVFFVKSLTIAEDGVLTTEGDRAIIVVAFEDMTIEGAIDIVPGTAGGEFPEFAPVGSMGAGARGGKYCGIGGWGEFNPALSLMPEGFEELTPLLGGNAGAEGPGTLGAGLGGGAIQLAAAGTFTLAQGASISAPGGAGLAASAERGRPGGGGSGGAVLIEANSVILRGTIAVNGGSGGGQAEGADGEAGRVGPENAVGGTGPNGFGNGGDGSSATEIDGGNGTLNSGEFEGGGGGGAGRIRINTATGVADLSEAVLSPSPVTPCLTIGLLN